MMPNRMLLVGSLALLLCAGCPDNKKCGEGEACGDAGAPPSDAGGGGTVTDAGEDAGVMDASVPYDGGMPCMGSMNPRLQCAVLAELATAPDGIDYGSLSARKNDFVVAWKTTSTLEVRTVALDGTVTTVGSLADPNAMQYALASAGSHWALATAPSSSEVDCYEDSLSGPVSLSLPDAGDVNMVSVAVTPGGAVGVAARSEDSNFTRHLLGRHSGTGCPASLDDFPAGNFSTEGASVVAAKSGTTDVFRYVRTGLINAYNGGIEIMDHPPGGTVTSASIPVSLHGPDVNAVAASTNGKTILIAYDQVETDDSYTLGYFATSSDLVGDGEPKIASIDPGYWSVTPCGAGCASTVSIPYLQDGPATVSFFSDDSSATVRGSWDAVCSVPGRGTGNGSVGVAYVGSKLGVLVTTPTSAKLYSCDVPPMP